MSNPDITQFIQNAQKTQLELECAQLAIKTIERQRLEAQTRVVQVEVELEMVKRQSGTRITELDAQVKAANERVAALEAQLATQDSQAKPDPAFAEDKASPANNA